MNVIGGPGSVTGLLLRIAQFIFVAASLSIMISTPRSYFSVVFVFLDVAMAWHICWITVRLSYDIFCLYCGINHHSRNLLSVYVILDWVTMLSTLGAGCSSLAAATLLQRDGNFCRQMETACHRYTTSAVLALFAWFFSYISALTMLWARAKA